MTQFLQQLVFGLGTGAIYASLGLAIVLIYRTAGMANFAQGEMAMFATYIAWELSRIGLPLVVAILLAIGISVLGGALIERTVIRPVENAPHLTVIMVTLGLFLVLNNTAAWLFSSDTHKFPALFSSKVWDAGGVYINAQSVGTLGTVLVVMGALFALLRFTKVGLALRAVSSNAESAELVGISSNRMLLLGWGLASGLGTLSGVLIAPTVYLDPNMMFNVLIFAFAAATLGGFDSLVGAVVGGLVLGVVENLAGVYVNWIGSDLQILVPLALIIAVLLVRPSGLFGSREVARL